MPKKRTADQLRNMQEDRPLRKKPLKLSTFGFTVSGADLSKAVKIIEADAEKRSLQEAAFEGTSQETCESSALAYARNALIAIADSLAVKPAIADPPAK